MNNTSETPVGRETCCVTDCDEPAFYSRIGDTREEISAGLAGLELRDVENEWWLLCADHIALVKAHENQSWDMKVWG